MTIKSEVIVTKENTSLDDFPKLMVVSQGIAKDSVLLVHDKANTYLYNVTVLYSTNRAWPSGHYYTNFISPAMVEPFFGEVKLSNDCK